MALVSVCVTSYNYGRFVASAVDSALAQRDQPVEVIVVDDGSTDDTAEVLARYGPAITVLHQANQGQYRAAWAGFARSRGDAVIFLDADDLLAPDTARRVVDALARTPGAARVQWRLRVVGPGGEPSRSTFPPEGWDLPEGDLARHLLTRRTYVWPPTSGNAYPRWALERLRDAAGTREPLIDLYLATTTPLLGPVVTLDGIGGSYRWHADNFSRRSARDRIGYLHDRIDETLVIHEVVADLAAEQGLGEHRDPLAARDWAFLSYRLASLRLDPASHPLPGDRVPRLARDAVAAVLTQPGYRPRTRLKRAAWLLAVAGTSRAQVARLVDRAYLNPAGRPVFDEPPAGGAAPATGR